MTIEFVGNLEEALSRFPAEVDAAAKAEVKRTAEELHKKVVRRTPKWTGRARQAWKVKVEGLQADVYNDRVVQPGEQTPKKKRRKTKKKEHGARPKRKGRKRSGDGGPVPLLQVLEKTGGVGARYKPGIMRKSARTERRKFRRGMEKRMAAILGKEPPLRKRPRRRRRSSA